MVVHQVEPAVQGREALVRQALKHRELQQVDVEVDEVELLCPTPHLVEHHESMSGMVADSGEPQAMRRARHELGCRFGVAARK